jgi:hypothetical protein
VEIVGKNYGDFSPKEKQTINVWRQKKLTWAKENGVKRNLQLA